MAEPEPKHGAASEKEPKPKAGAEPKDRAEPKDGAETYVVRTVPDKNGFQWVHIPRAAAHAHAKGKPGLVLWLMAAWFAASGGLEIALMLAVGTPWWSGLLGALSFLTGVGLILRVPWAYILGVLLPARFVVGFVMALGGGAQDLSSAGQADQVFVLAQAVIAVAVIFHLIEGERPNLIYRHRFRSYAAERQAEAERQAAEEREG
ncbi:MAG: hypothetical protein AAF865_09845 [Pseudomonadota bacterium]